MMTVSAGGTFFPVNGEWRRRIQSACVMRYEIAAHKMAPESSLLKVGFGAVDVIKYVSKGTQHAMRTLEDIRTDRPDNFLVVMPLRAKFRIRHNGFTTEVTPSEMTILNPNKPFEAYLYALEENSMLTTLQIRLPGSLLRRHIPNIEKICNESISIDTAAGRFMGVVIDAALTYGPYLHHPQVSRLSNTLVETVANSVLSFSDEMSQRELAARDSQKLLLLDRAKSFIEANLSEPELDVAEVAEYCNVSVRTLQNAFATISMPVASYVRETRLQRCREMLRNPQLKKRSISEIAGKWGFSNNAGFSRLYKSRFGVPPRLDRQGR